MPTRTPVALALVLTSALPSIVRATELHPALARAKQATGGERWSAIETTYTRATLKMGGLEGVIEDWVDVRRGRYLHRYTLGPSRGGEGYDATSFWMLVALMDSDAFTHANEREMVMSLSFAATSGGASAPLLHRVETPMGSWAYAIHGEQRRPGDPDILLAHGLFIDAALWRPYLEPLARLGRVFVIDMPGHGQSEVPPSFDLPGHADALAGAMTSTGIQRAICVGWSWGGALVMHLALRHPARVAALAVLDATAEAPSRYRRAKYRLLVEIVRVFGLAPWLARTQIVPLMLSSRSRQVHPELVQEFVRSATGLSRETVVRVVKAVAIDAPEVLDGLREVRVPTLVISGRETRAHPPEVSEHIARRIPGATLRWVEGAGHLSPWEQPDAVIQALVPFVASQLTS